MSIAMEIRQLHPSDYGPVIAVIDEWWSGRPMADMLPRLFFEHFADTSFAAERDGELIGFLDGFLSQSRPGEAYIHFVGIHPDERGRGLGPAAIREILRRRPSPWLPGRASGDGASEEELDRLPSSDGL
jgi:GNAT superfamily N-acetyltransferase